MGDNQLIKANTEKAMACIIHAMMCGYDTIDYPKMQRHGAACGYSVSRYTFSRAAKTLVMVGAMVKIKDGIWLPKVSIRDIDDMFAERLK